MAKTRFYAVCPVCQHTYEPATKEEMERTLLDFNRKLKQSYNNLIRLEAFQKGAGACTLCGRLVDHTKSCPHFGGK